MMRDDDASRPHRHRRHDGANRPSSSSSRVTTPDATTTPERRRRRRRHQARRWTIRDRASPSRANDDDDERMNESNPSNQSNRSRSRHGVISMTDARTPRTATFYVRGLCDYVYIYIYIYMTTTTTGRDASPNATPISSRIDVNHHRRSPPKKKKSYPRTKPNQTKNRTERAFSRENAHQINQPTPVCEIPFRSPLETHIHSTYILVFSKKVE